MIDIFNVVLVLSVIIIRIYCKKNGSAPRRNQNKGTAPHHSSIAITAPQTVSNATAATGPTYNPLIPHAFPPSPQPSPCIHCHHHSPRIHHYQRGLPACIAAAAARRVFIVAAAANLSLYSFPPLPLLPIKSASRATHSVEMTNQ